MRNEALLMLQYARLQKELKRDKREVIVLEASAMTGEGVEVIKLWLQGKDISAHISSKKH
jgi:hypothetical protein